MTVAEAVTKFERGEIALSVRQTSSAEAVLEVGATPVVGSGSWLGWLSEKISEAEKAVKVRAEMAATCRSGTNAQWAAASSMHPSTVGRSPTKGERLVEAARHDRIAVKLRHDLQMLKAIAAALSQPNTKVTHGRAQP